tara:strand:+ start:795 stop:2024 length:1230 start_codon:yes stop_codon:yes gene_type:complete
MTSNNNLNPHAPLAGVRVVEVANFLAAPICSALMADMGADVIKIEPPGGDTTRNMRIRAGQPPVLNHGFHALNRGKRSITIDLKQPGAADVVIELAKNADVFVTNLMTVRLEKYGITYKKITENNPIVFAQVTGWGSQGEGASRPGFDSTSYWAGSGLMGILGDVDTPAVVSRGGQGDYPAGLVLLTGILAALRLKEQTGTAQFVDGTLQRAGLWSMALESQNVMNNPNYHPERYDRMTADLATRNCYQTSDGRWMMLTMHNILYWKKFCIALGRPDWAEDPRYVSSDLMPQNQSELIPEIDAIFRSHPLTYWAEKLDENGCVWAVAASLKEVTTDKELIDQGAFHTISDIDENGNSIDVVSIPFSIDSADIKPNSGAPELGEHSQSILLDAGFSEDAISDIASKGILG